MVIALGGYGPWLPPIWIWLLTLVALHVVDAAAARSPASWEWRRALDWLRLHGFAIGLGSIVLMGICVRLSGVGRDLGHTPVDVDEYRLATTVLGFFRTGEVDHSTVESYPGILFWFLTGVYLFIYLAVLMEGVARNLQSAPLELFVLGGRVANIMLAAGTTAFTGLLARIFGGRQAGLVADSLWRWRSRYGAAPCCSAGSSLRPRMGWSKSGFETTQPPETGCCSMRGGST